MIQVVDIVLHRDENSWCLNWFRFRVRLVVTASLWRLGLKSFAASVKRGVAWAKLWTK
jgi:hypothetical protein